MDEVRIDKQYYVGSYSAAIHWRLLDASDFLSKSASDSFQLPLNKRTFGLINTEQDGKQLLISNPTRTIIDLLDKPKLVESIYLVEKALVNYTNSQYKDFDLMFKYAQSFPSGAFYKRLGFLLERNFPNQANLINYCLQNISRGYSYLDQRDKSDKIISKWNLWISQEMKYNF
jgi:predicted transcriptional regulator of viral defense system